MKVGITLLIAISLLGHSISAAILSSTSLTILVRNSLDASDDKNHVGAILLDPMSRNDAVNACAEIGETLLSASSVVYHTQAFVHGLQYLVSIGQTVGTRFFLANSTLAVPNAASGDTLMIAPDDPNDLGLPVLCTQSDRNNSPYNSSPSSINRIKVTSRSTGTTWTGYRNAKSFRFLGIPYANPVARFEYSSLYDRISSIDATQYSFDCVQPDHKNGKEDCLFLNIQTPYLPKTGSELNLKPVLFTIHGGGYTGGSGGAGFDTGNLVSREDIVGVSINYRLSTLGFLAVPGTKIRGNLGIGDQLTALRWVRQNIAAFGGDPDRITVIGESAGAGSVKALLGSPPIINENLIVGGIMQSNLGGGNTLGLNSTYATSYSSYYTIQESYDLAGQNIFTEAGCTQSNIEDQIACLKTIPAQTLVDLPDVARYVVQDGSIVNTKQLIVSEVNGSVAHVPVIIGVTEDDGASFFTAPQSPDAVASETAYISAALGIFSDAANSVINSGLYPLYNTGNSTLDYFNVSQHIATDANFHCIDSALAHAGASTGVFPAVYYYTFARASGGWDPNNLGATGLSAGPITPDHPNGNPNQPYFKLHAGELGFTYGNIHPVRDANDIIAGQLISSYFASFARTGNPNPSEAYLQIRGYNATLAVIAASGPWPPVRDSTGPTKSLDYISRTVEFPRQAQCNFLNLSLAYYLDGGR